MGIALTEREELKLLKSLPIASEYLACRWGSERWMGYCGRPGWERPCIRSPCLVCVLIWQWETSPLYSVSEPWVNSVAPPPTPAMYLTSVCPLGNLPSPHNASKKQIPVSRVPSASFACADSTPLSVDNPQASQKFCLRITCKAHGVGSEET